MWEYINSENQSKKKLNVNKLYFKAHRFDSYTFKTMFIFNREISSITIYANCVSKEIEPKKKIAKKKPIGDGWHKH